MIDGVKDSHRDAIVDVLAANEHVERAVLFGSRATETFTRSSDVDIALFGEALTITDLARLASAMEELNVPYRVDLLLYDRIENQILREHVRRDGMEWYNRWNGTSGDGVHLTPKYRRILEALIGKHLPGVEVWVYGNRVNGQSHDGSDLDLVLRGPKLEEVPAGQLGDFEEAIRESSIPFLVKARDWARLSDLFHREIERNYAVLVDSQNDFSGKSLGDYFSLKRGTTYKSALVDQPGPLLLGLSTIQRNGGFRSDSLKTYGGDSPDHLLVEPGGLYVSLKDITQAGDLLGAIARLPVDQPPGRLTQDTVKLIPKSHAVSTDYVYWVLRTPQYRDYCRAHATGTTNLGLPRNDFLAFPIPSDTANRRKIVEVLGALDDKIELNRRMNETLEAMAHALFKSWFVDFGPVRAKMEGCDQGLPRRIADLFPDRLVNTELGEIPEGWEVSEIGKEVNAVGGATPSTKEPAYWNGGQNHWATPKDLSKLSSPVLLETERKITNSGIDKITTGLLPTGTVLLSSRAPIGYLAITGVPTAVNQGFIAMICKNRLPNLYVLFWCYENLEYIKGIAGGSTFAEISKRAFRSIPLTVPSEEILSEYDRLTRPLYEQIVANIVESGCLTHLRDILLPKLVSGELSVKATETLLRGSPQ